MVLKYKYLICALLISFILTFSFGAHSFALNQDSIYVWSNNVSTLPTSTASNDNLNTLDNSRQFFRNHLWFCYFNRTTNWHNFI